MVKGDGRVTSFRRGALGGLAYLAVTGIGRMAGATPFLPELLALRLFELIPMSVFEFFIRRLGHWAKWTALAGTIGVVLLGAGIVGRVAGRWMERRSPFFRWAVFSCALAAATTLAVLPAVGSDLLGRTLYPRPSLPAPVGFLIGSAAYAAVLFKPGGQARRGAHEGAASRR